MLLYSFNFDSWWVPDDFEKYQLLLKNGAGLFSAAGISAQIRGKRTSFYLPIPSYVNMDGHGLTNCCQFLRDVP